MTRLTAAIGRNLGLSLAVLLFLVFYGVYNSLHPKGFSPAVLIQNSNESLALIMVAMAQTVPVLAGGLDLSVGAVMTLVNCIASHLLAGSPSALLIGTVVCLACGALAGFVNGCFVVYGRLQPIIATLATGAVYVGIALYLRPTPGGDIDKDLAWAFTNDLYELASTYGWFDSGDAAWFQPIAWVPVPLLLTIAVVVLVWLPFRATVPGGTSTPSAPARVPPTCRASPSTARVWPRSRWRGSSPASVGSTSRSRPQAATPTCRRPAATR
jgi:ribose transport system permease protein